MTAAFTAACVQFTAARDHEPNIQIVSELVRRARGAGADLVLTPENTGLIEPIGKLRREKARDETNHPVLAALRDVARETGAWLLIGSLAVDIAKEPGIAEGERRLANRSYLIDAGGGSSRVTTRSTCSTSISPAARAIAKATPSGRAAKLCWP